MTTSTTGPEVLTRNEGMLLRRDLLNHILDGKNRNIDFECGYPSPITIEHYQLMYDREGTARRVVHCLPEESWALPPEIYEEEGSRETLFDEAWGSLEREHSILHYLHRADEQSGIGRFGVLLLGIDDGKALKDPVEGVEAAKEVVNTGSHKLLFLRSFGEGAVTVASREISMESPRYDQPLTYTIQFAEAVGGLEGTSRSLTVHWTRVIHFADGVTSSEVFGTPRMEPVYNRLYDLRKVLSGSGEMFWKGAFPGFAFEVNPELIAQGASMDVEAMREEFANYSNGLQRFLALTGVTAKQLAPQVADPSNHVDVQLKVIAISLSIPFRILFGSEQAQLASSQDAKTWARRVARRQAEYLTPRVIRPIVDRFIIMGILPQPVDSYVVDWPDLSTPSDEDKAQVANTNTEALAKYVAGSVSQLIAPASFLKEIMGFSADTVEAIMKEAEAYVEEEEPEEEEEEEPGEKDDS